MPEKKTKRGGRRPGAGRPPKPQGTKYVRFLVTMQPDLFAALMQYCEQNGESRASVISRAVANYLEHGGIENDDTQD